MVDPTCSQLPVLLVDDEPGILRGVKMALVGAGIGDVLTEEDSRAVMPLLDRERIGVVVLDLMMPHLSGVELLSLIRARFPQIPVIILTASLDLQHAVSCMKLGAFDYHVKPVDAEKLVASVKRAREYGDLHREVALLRMGVLGAELENEEAFARVITVNEAMRTMFRYLDLTARTRKPILITGETGTGKDLLAEAIHLASGVDGPFVKANLAGFDDGAFAALLFGGGNGQADAPGQVRQAEGGTLYLDEIGDLGKGAQGALLRLLEDESYLVPGTSLVERCKARLVLSTNQKLEEGLENGRIRKDLYYRLQMRTVEIPSLRERLEDVPYLFNAFLAQAALRLGKEKPAYPPRLLGALVQYEYPGNVRELESMVEEAVSLSEGALLDLTPFRLRMGFTPLGTDEPGLGTDEPSGGTGAENDTDVLTRIFGQFPSMEQVQDYLIEQALKLTDGNQKAAASLLSITRQTIHRRLRKKKEEQG